MMFVKFDDMIVILIKFEFRLFSMKDSLKLLLLLEKDEFLIKKLLLIKLIN